MADRAVATLVPLLSDAMVPLAKIEADYPAFTGIVRVLIGLVPRCDSYLEIWPRAFKSYNLIVPNLMHVPFTQLQVGPGWQRGAALQGIGMYVVSRAAECAYCSAHTCSYALRRGANPSALIKGMQRDGEAELAADELATIAVARSLGRIPCELTDAERTALVDAVGIAVTEVAVFGMCAMGYLNKVMDSIGVELESAAYLETRDIVGADYAASKAGAMLDAGAASAALPVVDSLWTRLKIVPLVPGALALDKEYTSGVPNTWPAVGEHLRSTIGYPFPVLSSLSDSFLGKRAVVAIATVLLENFHVQGSVVGVPTKVLAGAVFARVIASASLAKDFDALAGVFHVSDSHMAGALQLAEMDVVETAVASTLSRLPTQLHDLDSNAQLWVLLARHIAPSPACVTSDLVAALAAARVEPQGVVELVNFIAVLQLLHRIDAFFGTARADAE